MAAAKPARTKTNAVRSPIAGIIDKGGQGPKMTTRKKQKKPRYFEEVN